MTKIKQAIAALVIVFAPLVITPLASAAGTCENGFTGPDSNNLCTSTTTYECTVVNDNTVTITNDNTQVAVTGDATGGEEEGAGSALTGSATNTNGVTYNVTVENEACTAIATVPATPTPTPTPETPGQGAVVTPISAATPKTLANTSSDSFVPYVLGAVAAFAAAFVVTRLALAAYSRFKA